MKIKSSPGSNLILGKTKLFPLYEWCVVGGNNLWEHE